ncbi:hypothetical protein CGLAMM_10760 [Acetobacteraceae bacterium EV16G]|uniref:Arsenic resistance protein n=1 Tax=Sorlinia euscelidii TaxID=3081148 RepID=A0ABU7U2X4_9PROT
MNRFLKIQNRLGHHQSALYIIAVSLGLLTARTLPDATRFEALINPSLGLMLYATFLQVPLIALGRAFTQLRFLGALLTANFVIVPLFVALLAPYLPHDRVIKLGVLIVLLCPCIDYVVTFAHLGRADAGRLLGAVPVLLIAQMVFLPLYLQIMLGASGTGIVHSAPFFRAFIWLIVLPLILALFTQSLTARTMVGNAIASLLSLLPVPVTACVLFIIVAAMAPHLGGAWRDVLKVAPFYITFSVAAPCLGWVVARLWRLEAPSSRAVAFSAGTRNSLVVLPLALTVPGGLPVIPAVIVTQTMIELASLFFATRIISRWGATDTR